jgi:hypothetical protein
MAITIIMKNDANKEEEQKQEIKSDITLNLNIRKTLDGNYIVRDHPLIDIILMPKTNKIIALSKDTMGDRTYYAQNKLFDFMYKKGVIDPASVQSGNIYSSMEATIPKPIDSEINAIQMCLLVIFKFLEEELPIFAYEKQYDNLQDGRVLQPDESESTELGEVPHKQKKGALGQAVPGAAQNAYNYMTFGE